MLVYYGWQDDGFTGAGLYWVLGSLPSIGAFFWISSSLVSEDFGNTLASGLFLWFLLWIIF